MPRKLLAAFGALVFGSLFLLQREDTLAQDPDLADARPDIEVLTRGPVHEAFAQPFDPKPGPGTPIAQEPPPPVPEEPPAERPEGDNVQYVQGYWFWDSDRSQFIWVSGGYRNFAKGMKYVPGYWTHTENGWVWVQGFVAPENQQEQQYVPEPPAPLEVEPALPPPDDNSVYVPGYWRYNDYRWAWRPGYYIAARPGFIWCPPRYLWTPYGYTFVNGCWDYPWEDRGLLFAPVCFHRPLWNIFGWYYRPFHYLNHHVLFDSFFCHRPSFHFHFGHYYGHHYARHGYEPWFGSYGQRDPFYQYYRWQNRNDPNWVAGLERRYADRVAGRVATPPLSLAQQNNIAINNQVIAKNGGKGVGNVRIVNTLNQAQNDNLRLVKSAPAQLEAQKANLKKSRELAQLRSKLETAGNGAIPATTRKGNPANQKSAGAGNFAKNAEPKTLRLATGGNTEPKGVNGGGKGKGAGNIGKGVSPPTTVTLPQPKGKEFTTPKQPKGNPLPKTADTPKSVAPPTPKNVSPPTPKSVAPPTPKGVAPPTPKSVAPPTPKSVAPSTPKSIAPPTPKSVAPKSVAPPAPKSVAPPTPKSFTPPTPKSIAPPAPKSTPPAPRTTPPSAPKSSPKGFSAPAPKANPPAPKFSAPPAPKSSPKTFSAPAPKANPPAPRITAPKPAPKASPPAPRISAPKSPPKSFAAPKSSGGGGRSASSSPPPRVSAPASPSRSSPAGKSSGGGGRSGGGSKSSGSKGKR